VNQVSPEKKQFVYILRPVPRLQKEEAWTEEEERVVGRHFAMLQALLKEGKLVLAGKTSGLDERTFGIVILEVDDEETAIGIMRNDPGVSEGIMTAELFPYHIALMQGRTI